MPHPLVDRVDQRRVVHDHHPTQIHLQRMQVLLGDEQDGVEERLPVADGVEQHQRRQRRLRQRQGDADQHGRRARAVDDRGVLQLVGQRTEEGAQDDDVQERDGGRQHQCPAGVEQADLLHQPVERDQAAGDVDGQHHHGDEQVLAEQFPAGQRVRGQDRQGDVDGGADHDVPDRVVVGAPHAGVVQDDLVGLDRQTGRHDPHLALEGLLRIADGDRQDVDERVQRHRHGDQADQEDDAVERQVGAAPGGYHSETSVMRLLTRLKTTRKTRLIVELNSPTAVAKLTSACSTPRRYT